MGANETLKARVKEMLVRQLKLQVEPLEITDDEPLFGEEGLGLDSIDVLEVVASVETEFGVRIESQEEGEKVLQNIETLANFVGERGGGPGNGRASGNGAPDRKGNGAGR